MISIVWFLAGVLAGGFVIGLIFRVKARAAHSLFEERLKNRDEKVRDLEGLMKLTEEKLSNSFKALSAEALKLNNESFLDLAKTQLEKFQQGANVELDKKHQAVFEMVKPVKESLDRVDHKIQELERARAKSDESLYQQVQNLMLSQKELRAETSNLVTALRAPQGRGRWGEIQLKRVVEMAGMLEHCDFFQQENVQSEAGRLRPDLIVKLPGKKNIVVDAKTPLLAYLEAIQAVDPIIRRDKFLEHSKQVRKHIEQLARKSYWDQFQPAPEFVVLFLPSESIFSAALEHDPSLIELGVAQNVIVSTPTTLIALLRSVAYGWRQEKLADNAKLIGELGKEVYKRLADMSSHLARLGKSLENSVESYNRAMGTLETRVLVTARKFKELESTAVNVELEVLAPVDLQPRSSQAPELNSSSDKILSS
ncbi:MAG: DNA recombination protein RmuC [Deltaproteobacteria bacterium]|nr:DNA recombination protein RmuC [Deltaproteobacteria bacterium]